jgi:hypothetical protein
MRATVEIRKEARAVLGTTGRDEEEMPEPEPRDKADSWLRAVAEEDDKVKNMILRDLVGKNKDFLNA